MPAGQHEPILTQSYRQHSSLTNGDESAASILQSVKEQEAQFEQLTRELEAERQSVANQLERCKLGSETASMSSISSTDDSFHWRGQQTQTTDSHFDEDDGQDEQDDSKMSGTQLVDSCLAEEKKRIMEIHPQRRVLQERGLMGGIGEDPMESYHNNSTHSGAGNYANYSQMNSSYGDEPYRMANGPSSYDPYRSGSPHGSHASYHSGGQPYPQMSGTKIASVRGPGSVGSYQNDERTSNYTNYTALQHPPPSPGSQDRGTPTNYGPRFTSETDPYYSNNDYYDHYHPLRDNEPSHYNGPSHPPDNYDDRYGEIPQGNSSYANLPPLDENRGDYYRPPHDDSYVNYPPLNEDQYSDRGGGHGYGNRPEEDYRRTPVDQDYRQSPLHDRGNDYPESGPRDPQYILNEDRPPLDDGQYQSDPYNDNMYPRRDDQEDPSQFRPRYDDDRYGEPYRDQDDQYRGPYVDDDQYPPDDSREGPHHIPGGYPPREEDHYPVPLEQGRYTIPPEDDDRYGGPMPAHLPPREDPVEEDPYRKPHVEEDPYSKPMKGNYGHPLGSDSYYPPHDEDVSSDHPVDTSFQRNLGPEDRYRTPSPGGSGSDRNGPPGYPPDDLARQAAYPVQGGNYDPRRSPSIDSQTRDRWRNPDLPEVIDFLGHPNDAIKANAAAYLQHLTYMDDPLKGKTRALGGIPALVELLNIEIPEVHRNACGALLNLSHGKANNENKRAIKNAGGIPALVRLLRRTPDNDVRELVSGIIWNLSSCQDLKRAIIDDALTVIVNTVVIPQSGWEKNVDTEDSKPKDIYWSTVFRNASGILRNVSSEGDYARKKLRECEGLVDSILYLLRAAIGKNDIDNKSVENCVCVLRNLSFRCQEVEDPDFARKRTLQRQQQQQESVSCFGGKKKKEPFKLDNRGPSGPYSRPRTDPVRGMELLWQPEIVHVYLPLLSDCSNPETLEAAAGAIQNLCACDWQPSIDIREKVRKEKGLPIIVECLGIEADRVVSAAAIALRNLALDTRNKELIGKYAMRQLVMKLPPDGMLKEGPPSDDTIGAVIATLHEVIRGSSVFAQSLLHEGGVKRLMQIKSSRGRYNEKVMKFTYAILNLMWQFSELKVEYKKNGWKEQHFVTKTPKSPLHGSPNNTLSRPMSDQSGVSSGYRDQTLPPVSRQPNRQEFPSSPEQDRYRPHDRKPEHIPMNDIHRGQSGGYATIDNSHRGHGNYREDRLDYGRGPLGQQPQPLEQPREPLYAQVDKRSKRRSEIDSSQRSLLQDDVNVSFGGHSNHVRLDSSGGGGGADSWV
ncbi:catenin delta-1 isoform X2 [Lingula anatina]|uniref:Catenin delta-1 isoform X2 n=1 Tax=Lingula anatina TaxID=7574 RepID=A0A2R2MTW5_LINAN|nr:catenin delta-1 isoform X2 [Lingula anatina]|eukprot:XP_023933568.1 catenin delta-1 isoform X2 [Lingula anatina]